MKKNAIERRVEELMWDIHRAIEPHPPAVVLEALIGLYTHIAVLMPEHTLACAERVIESARELKRVLDSRLPEGFVMHDMSKPNH